jgi:proline dehydrogenase
MSHSSVGLRVNQVARAGILQATNNRAVAAGVRRFGMRLGAARFVAGETLDQAIPVLKALNAKGMRVNTTILGEGIRDAAQAQAVADAYIDVLNRLSDERIDGNVALKLTHLGLDLGEEVAFGHAQALVRHAESRNLFVRLDMEESARVDATLRIYRRLREAGLERVGTVLQSYLYRTPDDRAGLQDLRPNLRLVKGAYLEPAEVAYPKKADVDRAYIDLAETMIRSGNFTAIATHDEAIIAHVQRLMDADGIDRQQVEFQMLYGIRSQLQERLVSDGYRVLIATPFGPDWYYYLMRRLAERPANIGFFVKNLVKR